MGKLKILTKAIKLGRRAVSSRAGRMARGTNRAIGRGSRASSRLGTASATVATRTSGRSARWLTRIGATLGLGFAVEAATRVSLESVFGDSTDQSGANTALQRVADAFVAERPTTMKACYDIATREGLWRFFEEGEIVALPDDDARSGFDRTVVRRGSIYTNSNGDIAHTLTYFRSVYDATLRAIGSLYGSLEGSDPATWLERETTTKRFTRLLIEFGRLQAITHLLMDSMEQFTGYSYGSLFRAFGATITGVALSDREILAPEPCEHLLRAMLGDEESVFAIDDDLLKTIATAEDMYADHTVRFVPLAF